MFCKNCGTALEETANACPNCGTATNLQPAAPVAPAPAAPAPAAPAVIEVIPPENRPLSAWAYFGLQILFAIPVIGFIFLIIFSFNGANINRRSFARSYWCGLLVALVVAIIVLLLAAVFGNISQSYF